MLTALGGIALCTGRVSFPRYLILCRVASSYLHLILVSSCETLPPYFQAWVSPVGASAFVAPGYPSLFLPSSFFLGVGGRACFFCSFVFYSFFLCVLYRMLLLLFCLYPFVLWLAYLFCSLFFLTYPFFLAWPSLPCLAWLCLATAALGVLSVSALSVWCPCFSSDLG